MQRRENLTHLILANIVVLVLTLLMVCVEAQAQIAFMSNRDGNPEIYVMEVDGNNQQRLTNNPHSDRHPSWSPDGKRIAFMSERDEHAHPRVPGWFTSEIYVMDADGGNPQNLTNDPNSDRLPSWSLDGKRIAFSSERDGNSEIYLIDADGNNQQRLTDNDFYDSFPSWSPDGKRIAFISRRAGHFIGDFGLTSEIYVMDADGQNEQRLTENRNDDWAASWSPDGNRIAFQADRKGDDVNWEIYVMDADGGNPRRLTNNRVADVSPSWSPDGKRIVFSSYRDGNAEIYVMDNDGGNQQKLTNNPRHTNGNPAWFGPAFAVAPAGKKFTTWGWLKRVDR